MSTPPHPDALAPRMQSKTAYERLLNDRGFPADAPPHGRHKWYGSWLRQTDLAAFNALHSKWVKEGQR